MDKQPDKPKVLIWIICKEERINKCFVIKSDEGYVSRCLVGTEEISSKEFVSDAIFFDSEDLAYRFMLDHPDSFIGFCYNFFRIECIVIAFPRSKK